MKTHGSLFIFLKHASTKIQSPVTLSAYSPAVRKVILHVVTDSADTKGAIAASWTHKEKSYEIQMKNTFGKMK